MGRKYAFQDHSRLYFVSFATINWIDVFVRREYFDIVVESLDYCINNKGSELYAWCIMSSHVHLIIGTESGNLSDIIRDLKRHTSKTLLNSIQENSLRVGENGYYGCSDVPELRTQTTKNINFGNKTTIL